MERSYLDSEQFSDAGKTLTPEQARSHCILSLLLRYAAPVVFISITIFLNEFSL